MASPLILLVASAAVTGGLATLVIIVSISVDSWQDITFDTATLSRINSSRSDVTIQPLSSSTQFYKVVVTSTNDGKPNLTTTTYYVHSSTNGLWRTCDHLSDNERKVYTQWLNETITTEKCFVFVTDYDEDSNLLTRDSKQIARLYNSAASCYIVVLIDLTSAIVVGLVGILHKQVASCMVTGVLYFMASLFSMFGLAMFHTKHYLQSYECKSFDKMPEALCEARVVDIMYAVPLAWIGAIICLFACLLWLVFARALRVIMAKTML